MAYPKEYQRFYFESLVSILGARCRWTSAEQKDLLLRARPISQFELWDAIRAITTWVCNNGGPQCEFSRASMYYGLSQVRAPLDLACDLAELSALWAGHKPGILARQPDHFPVSQYENDLVLAFLRAFLDHLFEKAEFEAVFSILEPPSLPAFVRDLESGRHELAYGTWVELRTTFTLSALELLNEFLKGFSFDELRRACAFVSEKTDEISRRITEGDVSKWIAAFFQQNDLLLNRA